GPGGTDRRHGECETDATRGRLAGPGTPDRLGVVVDQQTPTDALGPNAWLVDEMYEQYLNNPGSVSESWRDFFADYQRDSDVTESVRDQSLPATGRAGDTGQITAVKAGE